MFYRRKIILALLQAFEGQLSKISLQKLLFLFTSRQSKPDYYFIPYSYGCFSFSANADLIAMVKHKQLSDDKTNYKKDVSTDYIKTLREADKKILIEVKQLYGRFNTDNLMKFTYLNYPYYAINSIKAKEILSEEQYQNVLLTKPFNTQFILYTIGYEGISLEEYLNKLIKNDIKVLVDVRNNPMSMKFGFSKSQLKSYCAYLNIKYVHVPEVGIESDLRQLLAKQSDYDNLFDEYQNINLKKTKRYQEEILKLLIENQRIALTCFESNICQCHRKPLAEAIMKLPNWNYVLKHI